jgi:hypothetical protein
VVLSAYGPYTDGVYFGGTSSAPSDVVPALFPVAIAGRAYQFEPKFYKMAHLPMQRPATEQSTEPGESTVNPRGPWRRSQSDWALGAGQLWLDDPGVDPAIARRRLHESLGMEVFNDRSFMLLPETEQKRSSANTNLRTLRVGSRIYIVDGASVLFGTSGGEQENPQWLTTQGFTAATGLPGGNVLDIAFSGSHVYVLGSDNSIYRATPGTASFAGPFYNPTAVATRIFCGLGRLFMSDGRSLYEVNLAGSETLIFTHPDPSYVLSTLTAAPTGIYFAGNIGSEFGEVRHSWIKDDGTAFVAPVVAAELINEQIYVLRTAGNNILFGTSVGFRYAPIDNLATGLDFGPAVEIGAVRDMVVDTIKTPDGRIDTFAWGTWTNINGGSESGMVRIRLTRQTEPNVPAYASDIYTTTAGTAMAVTSINGRRYFALSTVGFYGATRNYVASGTLSTGRIRYGVLENKVFSDLKWRTAPLVGQVSAEVAFDTLDTATAGIQADEGSIGNEFSTLSGAPAEWGEITFTLERAGRTDNVLRLDGGTETASTPDHANFAITDLDVRMEIGPDDWTPGGLGTFMIGQWPNSAGNNGWVFGFSATGQLTLSWTNDGTTQSNHTMTNPLGYTDGTRHWVRVTLDVNNGAGGRTAAFYTSEDGTSWSLIESFTGAVTSIFNSTDTLSIGKVLPFTGKVYKADLRASIDGATVANPDFTRQAVGVTSFADTASTPKTWTVNSTATIEVESGGLAGTPEVRWWVMRSILSAEETMQIILPLKLEEKVGAGYAGGQVRGMNFLEELDFLMALSNSKQVVTYQEGRKSYSVYVNSIEVNPERWNDMDQALEGIVAVELHTVSHMSPMGM